MTRSIIELIRASTSNWLFSKISIDELTYNLMAIWLHSLICSKDPYKTITTTIPFQANHMLKLILTYKTSLKALSSIDKISPNGIQLLFKVLLILILIRLYTSPFSYWSKSSISYSIVLTLSSEPYYSLLIS